MRSSGILMPITALPAPYGVGGLGKAAYDFVDFLSAAGQSYWQVLPLGPTGFGDSPYQCFSAFAGNPYFIDLDILKNSGLLTKEEIGEDRGSDTGRVDYGLLFWRRFVVLAKAVARQNKAAPAYLRFKEENESWLDDYALYMAIKEAHGHQGFTQWPESLRRREAYALKTAEAQWGPRAEFWRCLQYFFFKQWRALKGYANAQGVKLVGDIPIYVSPDSSDFWANPELFQTGPDGRPLAVAGVPPDGFCKTGQLWGNPLYDWAHHKRSKYAWWMRRLRAAAGLYDVTRIDHFRGFASYWAVPAGDETAENGRWRQGPGWDFIRAVHRTLPDIKIIAEDLGFLTEEVFALLAYSGYPGMKVLQFAFDKDGKSAYLPHNYPHDTVVYTGTHDNDTTEGWKRTAPKEDVAFARRYLGLLEKGGDVTGAIRRAALASVADTAIIPLWDWLKLPSTARFNTPSTLGGNNWCWRVEKAALTTALAAEMRSDTKLYGRLSQRESEKEQRAELLKKEAEKAKTAEKGKGAGELGAAQRSKPGLRVLSRAEMKAAEAAADAAGTSYEQLMENAGAMAAAELEKRAKGEPHRLLLLCGSGNNAGDAFVLGRLLAQKGWAIAWVDMTRKGQAHYSPLAAKNLARLSAEVRQLPLDEAPWEASFVVDGVFGTGFSGEMEDAVSAGFLKANQAKGLRVALDISSGLDCDSGKAAKGTFQAALTLTFGAYKPALLMEACKAYTGEVLCLDIGL